MNAVIARSCNQQCSFCFAPNSPGPVMARPEIDALATATTLEGRDWVPLVGGEPTSHPDFPEIVRDLAGRGLRIRLFTHGQMGMAALEALRSLPPDRCRVVVNATATLRASGALADGVLRALGVLGRRAMLALTIDRLEAPYEAVLPLYQGFDLFPSLRIGLAQPVLGGSNAALPDYRLPGLGRRLTELCVRAHVRGVTPTFDCGFVICTFSSAQRRTLKRLRIPLRSVCGPIPDVAPGGEAWPCFPLAGVYHTDIRRHPSLRAVREHFDGALAGFRAAGLYPECTTCPHFSDRSCMGGCLARVIPTFARERPIPS